MNRKPNPIIIKAAGFLDFINPFSPSNPASPISPFNPGNPIPPTIGGFNPLIPPSPGFNTADPLGFFSHHRHHGGVPVAMNRGHDPYDENALENRVANHMASRQALRQSQGIGGGYASGGGWLPVEPGATIAGGG